MSVLLQGSIVLIFLWLVVGGIGLPIPEDVAVISAGILVHRGVLPWELVLPIVIAGVLIGDSMLFFFARRLGPKALEMPRIRKLVTPERRARFDEMYRRYGGRLIFLARHVAGLRGAVFALAGINRMAPRRFLFWDALAACISVPVTFALGYLGSAHIDRVRHGMARAEHWILLVVAVVALGYLAWWQRGRFRAAITAR